MELPRAGVIACPRSSYYSWALKLMECPFTLFYEVGSCLSFHCNRVSVGLISLLRRFIPIALFFLPAPMSLFVLFAPDCITGLLSLRRIGMLVAMLGPFFYHWLHFVVDLDLANTHLSAPQGNSGELRWLSFWFHRLNINSYIVVIHAFIQFL